MNVKTLLRFSVLLVYLFFCFNLIKVLSQKKDNKNETPVPTHAGPSIPGLTATMDCCQDTYFLKNEETKIPVHFSGNGPFKLTYKENATLKTVETTSNPFYITSNPSATTNFSLVSLSNSQGNGTVCGKTTVAINDSESLCASNCFKSEVVKVENNGTCHTVTLAFTNDGTCRFDLSHLSVSVPCGNVSSISNSENFKVEIGTDPTTNINGFKIDNISNFGSGGKIKTILVTYTICQGNNSCFSNSFCPPLVAYKAGQCVYYQKPNYAPINPPTDGETPGDTTVSNPPTDGEIPGDTTVSNPPTDGEIPGDTTVSNPPTDGETPGDTTVSNPPTDGETPGDTTVSNPPTDGETPGDTTVINPPIDPIDYPSDGDIDGAIAYPDEELSIFPQPIEVSQDLALAMPSGGDKETAAEVSILDNIGNEIINQSIKPKGKGKFIELRMEQNLSPGFYHVIVKRNGKIVRSKLFVK